MKIYVSLTSIFERQYGLLLTLRSILNQTKLPDLCYIYLSEEPYLLDTGFTNRNITNTDLKLFLETNSHLFKVQWVNNIGPYRKLLPLLKEKWNEDCLILTIDDDSEYKSDLIERYLIDYNKYKCCIGYRGFTINIDNGLYNINYSDRTKFKEKYLYNFLTGKGGGLYHPSFFWKTGDLIFQEKYFKSTCETGDDIWFNFIRIANNIDLFIKPICDKDPNYMIRDCSSSLALFTSYNNKLQDNKLINSINIQNTVKLLIDLKYLKEVNLNFDSINYWETRYKTGGNSGAGSYNNLALFKANIINKFIEDNNINILLDYGMGDGNQLKQFKVNKYIGLDISTTAINKCRELYKTDSSKCFYTPNEYYEISNNNSELVLSCDVLFHLIEDHIYYSYINDLFNFSSKFVIIYAKDQDYNHTSHVKFRKFTTYIENNYKKWKLIKHIPNQYPQLVIGQNNDTTSPSDFYIFQKIQ